MKKLIFLLLCILFASIISAQVEKKIAIMPQVGLNFSKFVNEPSEANYGVRTGYQLGLFVRTNKVIFIQPGIFFSRQGNQLYHYSELTSENILDNVDYNMVKIPVFFGIRIWNLRLYTGPTISFFTNVHGNEFGFERDDFGWATAGLNVGAGLHLGILSFDCHYEFGLTPISPDIDHKVNVLTVNVGLHFKL